VTALIEQLIKSIAQSVDDPSLLVRALIDLAEALATAGEHHHAVALTAYAEQLTQSVSDSDSQAKALTDLACGANPARARSFIAQALAVGRWSIPLKALAHIDLMALTTFVDECKPHHVHADTLPSASAGNV
jgi:hypothetical protein